DEFEWQAISRMTKPMKQTKLLYPRFTKLIIDHLLSTNKSLAKRSNAFMHSEEQDSVLSKLINSTNGELKFGKELLESMLNNAIKQLTGYIVYKSKRVQINVSSKPNNDVVPRIKRTITIADNIIETEDEAVMLVKSVSTDEQRLKQQELMTQLMIKKEVNKDVDEAFNAKKGKKLKGVATVDLAVQSLLDFKELMT
ncbi:hypothetical protein Tco_0479417, partial [Tanacetum coccineum]